MGAMFASLPSGRIDDLPKLSRTLLIRVRTSDEWLVDSCRSRENCARRWLIKRVDKPLVREMDPDSVATSSSPLSVMLKVVTRLAGSKNTLFVPK